MKPSIAPPAPVPPSMKPLIGAVVLNALSSLLGVLRWNHRQCPLSSSMKPSKRQSDCGPTLSSLLLPVSFVLCRLCQLLLLHVSLATNVHLEQAMAETARKKRLHKTFLNPEAEYDSDAPLIIFQSRSPSPSFETSAVQDKEISPEVHKAEKKADRYRGQGKDNLVQRRGLTTLTSKRVQCCAERPRSR